MRVGVQPSLASHPSLSLLLLPPSSLLWSRECISRLNREGEMKHLLSDCQLPQATVPSSFHPPQYFSFLSHSLSLNFSFKCLLDFEWDCFKHISKRVFYRHFLSLDFCISFCSSAFLLLCLSLNLNHSYCRSQRRFCFPFPCWTLICFHPSFTSSLLLPPFSPFCECISHFPSSCRLSLPLNLFVSLFLHIHLCSYWLKYSLFYCRRLKRSCICKLATCNMGTLT